MEIGSAGAGSLTQVAQPQTNQNNSVTQQRATLDSPEQSPRPSSEPTPNQRVGSIIDTRA